MARARAVLLVALVALTACTGGGSDSVEFDASTTVPRLSHGAPAPSAAELTISVEPATVIGPISPLIRGLSGGIDQQYLLDVGATVNSWGGNPATRFNYEIGHAWNAGKDYEYRNTDYGQSGDAAADFVTESAAGGAIVRVAVPMLGWVAKDDRETTCSFPAGDGCQGDDGASCRRPEPRADPTIANTPSTPAMVSAWADRLIGDGSTVRFVAMDNEPELWGDNHYDVHPTCPTYEEILDRYLTYADAIRNVAPAAELLGPVACCWFDYWDIAPGPADGSDVDYITWFLQQVREHDERTGRRTLDALDVHYYPQSNVYNDDTDPDTAARRLRSTRSLWDATYVDESWIGSYIRFVPRLREIIASAYPDTELAISEWNFGADTSMNGALAIADTLGIYGREGVYVANYWRAPPEGSPGYFAFKLFGNYDGAGSSFQGNAVEARSPDVDRVSSYAALDPEGGRLRLVLLNKQPDENLTVRVELEGSTAGPAVVQRYSEAAPDRIVTGAATVSEGRLDLELPAYSITLVELAPAV